MSDPFDAGETADAEASAARRAAQVREDWRWLLADPRGRRIAWDLIEACGIFRSSFVAGSPDQVAFNEGGRNVGLRLLSLVMLCDPAAFTTMQREAQDSRES